MVDGNAINLFVDDMLLFRVIQSTVDFDHIQYNIGLWVEAS